MISVNLINTVKLRQLWFATWQMKSSITFDLALIEWFMVIHVIKNLPVQTVNETLNHSYL